MRTFLLVLISSIFFSAATAQSYTEPLNALKKYMQSVEKLYVTNLEVKENYLYIYSYGDSYEKINLKKLGAAVANTEKKFVMVRCLHGADCEFSSITKTKSNMLMFLDHNDGVCDKLPALFNDFIKAYDQELGITYVPPPVPDNGGIPVPKPAGFGEVLYADNTPAPGVCANPATVRVYGIGNSSIRVNDSKDTLSNTDKLLWLENSALAFSENEQELYFRHPTGNYCQVWNIESKKKTAEISVAEAGNTPQGRRVFSSFRNAIYPKDTYLNTAIWISEDLNIQFDKNEHFTISSVQQAAPQQFSISLRGYAFECNFIDYEKFIKKVPLSNIRYCFNFNKQLNKLYLIITGDQITKEKSYYPYCGVYSYDLTSGKTEELMENIKCQTVYGDAYTDRWYFSDNSLVHAYVRDPSLLFKQFPLAYLTKKDLAYSCLAPNWITGPVVPDGWYMQYAGSDSSGHPYLCKPLNNGILISKHQANAICTWEPVVNIRHAANRRNMVQRKQEEILNVLAVSPSGKLFAYLNLQHIPEGGNIASIMLYNDAEKDRVYTLNDQEKYQPGIAKNYITDKESEALEQRWKSQGDLAKRERQAAYQKTIDSLQLKMTEINTAISATYKRDLELAGQKKYGEILAGKKWVGYKTYLSTMSYAGENGGSTRTITSEFGIQEEMVFAFTGQRLEVKTEETLKLPRGAKTTNGDLLLKDKDMPDNSYALNDYGPVRYIISKCTAPVEGLKTTDFSLGNTAYIACNGGITGDDAINESRYYKKFTDEYMHFLWNCTFKIYKTPGNEKVTITATGKNGIVIGFDYENTPVQQALEDKRAAIQKQLSDLQQYIENGK